MRQEVESMIRRLEQIHPLPDGGREHIASMVEVRDLPKGGYFVRAGETPTQVGYMVKGWLRYFTTDVEGREFVRYFCNGGNFVTSQSALIKDEPSAFAIQALEDAKMVVFAYMDWVKLLGTHTAWGIINKSILDQALVRAEQREKSLILDDAASRYRQFLDEFPDAEEHVKQYDIASYLGVSPVTLSRIRGSKPKASTAEN